MTEHLHVDMSALQKAVRELGKPEQYQFAASLTLNRLVLKIQERVWDRLLNSGAFHIRRAAWNKRAIAFLPENRATRHKLVAVLLIREEARNLQLLEAGDPQTPKHKYLLVPNPEVFKYSIITAKNKLHPRNLNLHKGERGTEGLNGTFMIESKSGTPLILQRMGKGKRAKTRLLYTLVHRKKVPAKLHFMDLATSTINSELDKIAQAALEQSMRTAR